MLRTRSGDLTFRTSTASIPLSLTFCLSVEKLLPDISEFMDPAFGWIQPEQLGPAYEFWQRLWEKEQSSFENLNNQNMSQLPQNSQSSMDSYILLDDNDYAKGLKRKRDGSNKASTMIGLSKYRNRLIGKYEGCPWLVRGKRYTKGIIG